MITRSLLRRPGLVARSLAHAPARCIPTTPFRSIHKIPTLQNEPQLVENGIPGLLSKRGFEIAWKEYQGLMVDDLNTMTAGTKLENQPIKDIVIEFARNPTAAHPFNVASMAWNNNFFFRGLSTDANVVSEPTTDLTQAINDSFSSMDTFREEYLATAEAMFGPGFVWLVQKAHQGLFILPTYLAGSPLSGAHYRRQTHDLNTESIDSYQNLNKAGAFGASSGVKLQPQKPLGGVDVTPLLCVNTWEHAWMHDYGVRGKRQYLEAWWDKINWNVVADGLQVHGGNRKSGGGRKNERYQFQT